VIEELAITENGSSRLGTLFLTYFDEISLTLSEYLSLTLDLTVSVGFRLARTGANRLAFRLTSNSVLDVTTAVLALFSARVRAGRSTAPHVVSILTLVIAGLLAVRHTKTHRVRWFVRIRLDGLAVSVADGFADFLAL